MANWAMLGQSVGQGFNRGFTSGVEAKLEEERKKRYEAWQQQQKEEAARRERERLAREANDIQNLLSQQTTVDPVGGAVYKTLFPQQQQKQFSFGEEPQNIKLQMPNMGSVSTPNLQSGQAAPNQSINLNYNAQTTTDKPSSLSLAALGNNNPYMPMADRASAPNRQMNFNSPTENFIYAITEATKGGNSTATKLLNAYLNGYTTPTTKTWVDPETFIQYSQNVHSMTGEALGDEFVSGIEKDPNAYYRWMAMMYGNGNGSGAKNSYTTETQMIDGVPMDGSFNKHTGEFTPTAVNQKWIDDIFLPDMAKHLGRDLTMDDYYSVRDSVSSTGNLELAKNYLNRGRPNLGWTPWNTENDEQLLKEWDNINLGLLPFGYADEQWLNERFKEIYFQSKELQKYIKQLNNPELNAVVEQIIGNLNANIPNNAQPLTEEDLKNIGLE